MSAADAADTAIAKCTSSPANTAAGLKDSIVGITSSRRMLVLKNASFGPKRKHTNTAVASVMNGATTASPLTTSALYTISAHSASFVNFIASASVKWKPLKCSMFVSPAYRNDASTPSTDATASSASNRYQDVPWKP